MKESGQNLIGELRSLLDGEFNDHAWDDIVVLLDRAQKEDLRMLVDYLQPFLLRRKKQVFMSRLAIKTPTKTTDVHYKSPYFHYINKLRYPPERWQAALEAGENSPLFELIQGIYWSELALDEARIATTVIENEGLCHLEYLAADKVHFNLRFLSALTQSACAESLRILGFDDLDDPMLVRLIHSKHKLHGLKEITWQSNTKQPLDNDRVGQFFSAGCFDNVEVLRLHNVNQSMPAFQYNKPSAINQLILDGKPLDFHDLHTRMDHRLFRGIKVLSFFELLNDHTAQHELDAWLKTDLSHIKVLDLSGYNLKWVRPSVQRIYFGKLAKSTLLNSPESVYLGAIADLPAAQKILKLKHINFATSAPSLPSE